MYSTTCCSYPSIWCVSTVVPKPWLAPRPSHSFTLVRYIEQGSHWTACTTITVYYAASRFKQNDTLNTHTYVLKAPPKDLDRNLGLCTGPVYVKKRWPLGRHADCGSKNSQRSSYTQQITLVMVMVMCWVFHWAGLQQAVLSQPAWVHQKPAHPQSLAFTKAWRLTRQLLSVVVRGTARISLPMANSYWCTACSQFAK